MRDGKGEEREALFHPLLFHRCLLDQRGSADVDVTQRETDGKK
jgi:hypothetical protein